MKKLKGIVESSTPPSTTDVAWLYRGVLKHFSRGKWTEVGGGIKELPNGSITIEKLADDVQEAINNAGGVPIVDSVDKLDPNAPSGSLATVSTIKTEEIEVEDRFSVRDIYVEENPDCESLMELKVKPNRFSGSARVVFAPKGYSADTVLSSGTYFTFMGSNVSMNSNGEYSSATIINDNYGSLSVNEEGVSLVNEFIKNIGGVVLYGQISLSSGKPEQPTESEFNSLENIFGYDNSYIETIEIHTNDIYFKETTGWRKINDVKIVDSVDKLDKNAPQGSLASVIINTTGEVPFSELYQPTEEDFDPEIGPVGTTNLSSVSGISVIALDPSIEPPEFEIELFSEDFNPENNIGTVICLFFDGYAELYNMSDSSQNMELNLLIYNEEENTLTINEENLAELNNILSEKNYFYGGTYGPANEDGDWGLIDPSISDYIYRVISGVQKTDLYIKDVEGWKVVGDELKAKVDDLQTIVDNLEDTVNNLEDKIDIIVNSVEELPNDVLLGTLAQVLFKKEKATSLNTITYSQEITADNLVVLAPKQLYEEIYLPPSPVGTIIFKTQSGDKSIAIYLGSVSGGPSEARRGLMWSIDGLMPTILLGYSEGGELIVDNREAFVNKITTDRYYFRASDNTGFGIIADYFVGLKPVIIYDNTTKLFIKNINGWEQYSELVDQSVTTEKISAEAVTTEKVADGTITMDKLSQELQESIAKIATLETKVSELETKIQELLQS